MHNELNNTNQIYTTLLHFYCNLDFHISYFYLYLSVIAVTYIFTFKNIILKSVGCNHEFEYKVLVAMRRVERPIPNHSLGP